MLYFIINEKQSKTLLTIFIFLKTIKYITGKQVYLKMFLKKYFMKVFIQLNATFFLLYGIGFIFFPVELGQLVTGASPDTTSGLIGICATYGGMSVGLGILLFYLTKNIQTMKIGLLGILFIVGEMALGRTTGIVVDSSPNTIMYAFLLLEIVVVIIALKFYTKAT